MDELGKSKLSKIRRMQTSATKTTLLNAVRDTLQQNGKLSTYLLHKLFYQNRNVVKRSAELFPGVRGLYTGLTASILRQMTYSVTRLGAYDMLKNTMSKQGKSALPSSHGSRSLADIFETGAKKLTTWDMVICASGAGALGGLAGNPAGELCT